MKNYRKGFTLVELMLVVALIGVASMVAYSVFDIGQKSFEVGIDKGVQQADHRILREYINNELRYITKVYTSEPDAKKETIKYHSLEIKEKTDGKYLLKTVYDNPVNVQPSLMDQQTIPIHFSGLQMKTSDGKIEVSFTPINSTRVYPFTIGLQNIESLGDKIILDSSDGLKQKIYYAYPQDIREKETETN